MSDSSSDFDVAILGGGLAGLTLGLQLKAARPSTSIVIAEKRVGPAPEAAFKVGESTVEVSTKYFADVVGMRDHLDTEQLPKCGLRFFFPAGKNEDIALRVEYGSPAIPPVHSYQLDRGRFENELAARNVKAGNTVLDGARVQEIELDGERKRITITRGEETSVLAGRWVVDAAGRAGLLKRKLGLAREVGHHVNSAWFRLAGGLDIDEWSDDEQWHRRMTAPGLRALSTNHLCGQGYWVWLIPLSSGPISIGIVADPRFHPFERINTQEAAMAWLGEHEPQLAQALEGRSEQIEDFLRVEDFAMGCERQFSPERWCLVGEAGAFADPFYSPGSDYIALGNTFATDLICRDLDGEDIAERADAHDRRFQALFAVTLSYYEGQYGIWRNAQVMNAKITADYFYYWATTALLFFHRKLTDLQFMSEVQPLVDRAMRLTPILQHLFREWDEIDHREWLGAFSPPTAFPQLPQRHLDLHSGMDDDRLRTQLAENIELYEALAVTMFAKAVESLPGVDELDPDAPINPYAISLDPKRWEADGLHGGSGMSPARVADLLRVRSFWMEQLVPRRFGPRRRELRPPMSEPRLKDRVALVTGGSRGIGRSIAEVLAAEGAAVAVNYRSGEAQAQEVVEAIRGAGGQAAAIGGDVSDYAQAEAAVKETSEQLGGIHILINNAGISKDALIYNMDPGEWLDVMRVNFGGTFNCTKAALSSFMSQREGAIVNISSVMGERGWTGESNYAASKGAINAFTRCCAVEFARFGIRVNAVLPGFAPTDMVAGLMDKDGGKGIIKQIPMKRFATVQEVARTAVFLAGPDSSHMTGALLTVDGGVSAQVGIGKPL